MLVPIQTSGQKPAPEPVVKPAPSHGTSHGPSQELVDAASRFAKERLAPYYRAREAALCIERDLVRELGGLGFLGPELPESFPHCEPPAVPVAMDRPADRGMSTSTAAERSGISLGSFP